MNLSEPPHNLYELDNWIAERENSIALVKPTAKARIVWKEPQNRYKTPYSILYLHGFKASHGEGDPVHRQVTEKLGFNLYLSRLAKHGLNDIDAFKNLESNDFIHAAETSLEIAQQLGEKVIIMGTSTGASLGLYLASKKKYKESIGALLLYSPLVQFYGLQKLFLSTSLGRSVLKSFLGSNYQFKTKNKTNRQAEIWYSSYHINGVLALGEFVENYMNAETFKEVSCPVFTAYYYKNFWQQDKVVSVPAIKKMHNSLGAASGKKKIVQLPRAGSHVISNGLVSKSITELEEKSTQFLRKQLALKQL